MNTIAIAGVGLIGGSFALAARKAGFSGRILGVSSPSTIREALDLEVIDEGVSIDEACRRADLVYLAQPILRIIAMLPLLKPHLRPGALVTDAGSTKVQIVDAAEHAFEPGQFVGGHPMAGKEVRGVAAADADLFAGRPYVLTPVRESDLRSGVAGDLLTLIERIRARPVILLADAHDRIVAYTSHLPQLLSTALASTLSSVSDTEQVAGPSVIDLTRLALSPFEMWSDILLTNSRHVSAALDEIIDKLMFLKDNMTSSALESVFEEASATAARIRNKR